jgi:hypothetical protein
MLVSVLDTLQAEKCFLKAEIPRSSAFLQHLSSNGFPVREKRQSALHRSGGGHLAEFMRVIA